MNWNPLIKCVTFPVACYTRRFPSDMGKTFLVNKSRKVMKKYSGDLKMAAKDGRKFIFHFPEDYGCDTVYFYGTVETGTTNLLKTILKKNSTVFDAGANFGWYTTFFGKLIENGECHSFEPVPWIFNELKNNCEINKVLNNITLNQVALGDSHREVEMFTFRELPHGHSSISNLGKNDYKISESQMITLNDYISEKKIKKVDLIKCDIEGAELQMLKGATDLFSFKVPPMWIFEMNEETSSYFGYYPYEILNFLKEFYNYKFYRIKGAWGNLLEMKSVYDYENGDNVFCMVPKFHGINSKLFNKL